MSEILRFCHGPRELCDEVGLDGGRGCDIEATACQGRAGDA